MSPTGAAPQEWAEYLNGDVLGVYVMNEDNRFAPFYITQCAAGALPPPKALLIMSKLTFFSTIAVAIITSIVIYLLLGRIVFMLSFRRARLLLPSCMVELRVFRMRVRSGPLNSDILPVLCIAADKSGNTFAYSEPRVQQLVAIRTITMTYHLPYFWFRGDRNPPNDINGEALAAAGNGNLPPRASPPQVPGSFLEYLGNIIRWVRFSRF